MKGFCRTIALIATATLTAEYVSLSLGHSGASITMCAILGLIIGICAGFGWE